MMLGGGMMFGIGLLMMLLFIGIPVLFVIVLLGGTAGFLQKQNRPADAAQKPFYAASNPVAQPGQPVVAPTRACAHCGAGLQSGWTHCPHCGAPVS